MLKPLTKREIQTLQFALDFYVAHDRLPRGVDVAMHWNFATPTGVRLLMSLRDKGYLEKSGITYRFSREWKGRPKPEVKNIL